MKNKDLTRKLDKNNIEDILSLVPVQEGMLFHYLKEPGSVLYFEQLSLEISGPIDRVLFERAWDFVVQTNEMLRTVFRWEKVEKPLQIVLREHKLQPRYIDLPGENDIEPFLEKIKIEDRDRHFDLQDVPFRVTLCKTGERNHEMIVSSHHILYDGWSNGIILKEFFNTYNRLFRGEEPAPTRKTKFREFVKWTLAPDGFTRRDESGRFWKDYLEGFDTPSELSIKRSIRGKSTGDRANHMYTFDPTATARLNRFTTKRRITPASLLYSAWGVLLQKYNTTDDVLFGTSVSGRSVKVKDIEEVVGLFINTVPLRVASTPGETVEELLQRIDNLLKVRQSHEHTSIVEIKEYGRLSNKGELFDTIMVIENYPLDSRLILENSVLTVISHSMFEATNYDLTAVVTIGDSIAVDFIYPHCLFDHGSIQRLSGHFEIILESIMSDPTREIAGIEIVSAREKQQLLYEFNQTGGPYPGDKTIHQLFREQAGRTPDRTAVQAADGSSLTYRQLNEKTDRIARLLLEKGVKPGNIVALMAHRSIEMVIGILGTLKSNAVYVPIDPDSPKERILYMLIDSNAKVVLAQLEDEVPETTDGLIPLPFVIDGSERPAVRDEQPAAGLAYIIYTSGSTGKPKGVMVEHRSVVNILKALQDEYPLLEEDVYLFKTSYLFDVSVSELFGWFMGGGRLAVLEAGGEKDPNRILDAVESAGVTHINFVPSMFNVFVETLTAHNIYRLKRLKYIFLAGEALLPELVEKFKRLQTGIFLENIYGPTEGTVYASNYSLGRWSGNESVYIGKPMQNVRIRISAKDGRMQPVGVPGELHISGTGVARGYLNNPELTAKKFNRSSASYKSYIFYKTGDLARWMPDGNIEYLGRIDHQVKIRGFRIELGEIENQLLNFDEIKEAVVILGSDGKGDKYLCAYIVTHTPDFSGNKRLRNYLREKLPDYMIPSYFVTLPEMPLTPTGKIDRRALPSPEVERSEAYIAPRDAVEETLAGIWSAVLGIKKDVVGIDRNFFEIGGHSLRATVLVSRIHKALNVRVPLSEVFRTPTIRGLGEFIKGSVRDVHASVEPAEKREYYPLSSAQKRLYILQVMEPGSTAYNMPKVIPLGEEAEIEKLESTFQKLIERHESLRTSFLMIDDEPVQRVYREVVFKIEYSDADAAGDVRPFDLSTAPLLRAGVLKTEEGEHFLLVDMHHIISDGVSQEIVANEFMALYGGETPEPLRIQYKDFSQWQNSDVQMEKTLRQESYWLEEFFLECPVLELPLDFSRPAARSFEGDTVNFEVPAESAAALKALALSGGATVYMVLLGVIDVFLSRLSGQEDIVVGTPVAGRRHVDLEKVVGMFVNTLALRNYPSGDMTFSEFLNRLKRRALGAFENQEYPFEDLVDKLTVNEIIKRDTGRNPVFDVMFSLITLEGETGLDAPGVESGVKLAQTAKFDLTVTAIETPGSLFFSLQYCTRLFKRSTVERFANYLETIISSIAVDRDIRLSEIEILPAGEKVRLLMEFNRTDMAYPSDRTVHELFEEQVEKTPHRIAVNMSHTTHMTYTRLNEASNRLARALRRKGAGAGTVVGLTVSRSLEMVISIFGILKSGAAYLPVDSGYPFERKRRMLSDSSARLVISDRAAGLDGMEGCEVIDIENTGVYFVDRDGTNLEGTVTPDDMIYTIFTSGSTGLPKGAGVYHRGFMNLLNWYVKEFDLNESDSVLLLTSLSFDLTQKNIYAPLVVGGRLVIPALDHFDPYVVIHEVYRNRLTWLNCTPGMFYKLVEEESELYKLSSLRYVFLGGEPISPVMLSKWFTSSDCGGEIVNTYGPTECTDVCSYYRNVDDEGNVPLGVPVYNAQLYVLDRYLRPVPTGVCGELCISGAGVGLGYINHGELTAEKFVSVSLSDGDDVTVYRTGDLARRREDGNIEFIGRVDFQVKVRGFRIELGEIEERLLKLPQIKETVVLVRGNEDKYLCAYIVYESPPAAGRPDSRGLKTELSRSLPDYMIPTYFVEVEKMPLTPNGKIDHKVLPEPVLERANEFTAPRDIIEKNLMDVWRDVLFGIETSDPSPIGIDENFFELGGHSLKAVALVSKIHKVFNVNVPLAEIFKNPTLRGLSNHIREKAPGDKYVSIEPVEKKAYYPLSSSQQRLYFLHRMESVGTAYNMSDAVLLSGKLNMEKLEHTLHRLINRHEGLRTSFLMIDGEPVQRIHESVNFKIEYFLLDKEDGYPGIEDGLKTVSSGIIDQFIRPFDLSRAPLFRVGLLKQDETHHLMMLDMHHIISDGISQEILTRDFMALYEGGELPALPIHYKDFSQWRRSPGQQKELEKQEVYWLKQFEGNIPHLMLPVDFERPSYMSFEGRSVNFELDPGVTRAVKALALQRGATLHMTLLAIFVIMLAKLSGQEDIVVGMASAGRSHADLDNVIGFFLNILAVRYNTGIDMAFGDFLEGVRTRTLEAYANRDYPFEDLVEKLVLDRAVNRHPLFNAMFGLQNMDKTEIEIPGLTLKSHGVEGTTSKIDLTMLAFEAGDHLEFTVEYSTRLFEEETIRRFITYYSRLVDSVIKDPGMKILEMSLITEEESERILARKREDENALLMDFEL